MGEIFSEFELVPETELKHGLNQLVVDCGLSAISLDRVYYDGSFKIDVSRLVDFAGNNQGLGERPSTLPLAEQIKQLQDAGIKEAALVDDVIFSGDGIVEIVELLESNDIHIPLVCAGIGIAQGIHRIHGIKCEISCVRTYDDVIDEVCERDFYPGVPFSGRLLVGSQNIGAPYLQPFGDPEAWASIPASRATSFSRFCLRSACKLFAEIEECSNREVLCHDLDRQLINFPIDHTRFVGALEVILSAR